MRGKIPKFMLKRGKAYTQDSEKSGVIPRYVIMEGKGAFRYDPDTQMFFRVAGNWGVRFVMREGKIFSVSAIEAVNNKELVPTTREVWYKDNLEKI